MFKFLITAAIIYFIYRFFNNSKQPIQRPPRDEPLPRWDQEREKEKRTADDDYIDYEEID